MEEEVGDLFFVLVNIARYLSLDPESALRKTNRKFKRRFQWMEERLHESGQKPADRPPGGNRSRCGSRRKREAGEPRRATAKSCRPAFVIRELPTSAARSSRPAWHLQKEVWNFTDAELVPLRCSWSQTKLAGR